MDMKNTGTFIRELRTEKNLTQQQLADQLHVSPTAVSKWENGHSLPDISVMPAIADYFGVTVTDIINGSRTEIQETEKPQEQVVRYVINQTVSERKSYFKIILALTVLVVLLSLYVNSYRLALLSIGYKYDETEMVYTGLDGNGQEFRVVADNRDNKYGGMAIITRNKLGIWMVSLNTQEVISWSKYNFGRVYVGTPEPSLEIHVIYCGNNAVRKINDLSEIIPNNCTAYVEQHGSSYLIHLMSYSGSEEYNRINLYGYLLGNGYIE